MPTDRLTRHYRQGRVWIEGGGLLAATPFLLFPTLYPVVTAVALLWVAASWLWPLLAKRRQIFPVTPLNISLLLWSLMLIIGIGVTADPDITLPKATGLILGLAVWRYVSIATQSQRRLGWGLLGFILLGLGFAFLGMLSVDWKDKISFLTLIVDRLPSRLIQIPESAASGVGANQLAGTIEIHFILLLSLLIGWRPQRRAIIVRAGLLFLTIVIAGLLVITQSRSGWIGGVGGIFTLLFLWGVALPPSKKRYAIWFVVAIIISVTVVGVIEIGPEAIIELWDDPAQETVIGQLGTLNFRKEVWQWGMVAVQDFPFTGTGLGTFRRVVKRLYPLNVPFDYDIAHAHNIFLQVALDVGLPGLVAYLAILINAVMIGWQVAKRDEQLRPFALGLLAGLAALHIYGLTDVIAPGSKPGLIFWAALGLLTAMHQITLESEAGKA